MQRPRSTNGKRRGRDPAKRPRIETRDAIDATCTTAPGVNPPCAVKMRLAPIVVNSTRRSPATGWPFTSTEKVVCVTELGHRQGEFCRHDGVWCRQGALLGRQSRDEQFRRRQSLQRRARRRALEPRPRGASNQGNAAPAVPTSEDRSSEGVAEVTS